MAMGMKMIMYQSMIDVDDGGLGSRHSWDEDEENYYWKYLSDEEIVTDYSTLQTSVAAATTRMHTTQCHFVIASKSVMRYSRTN